MNTQQSGYKFQSQQQRREKYNIEHDMFLSEKARKKRPVPENLKKKQEEIQAEKNVIEDNMSNFEIKFKETTEFCKKHHQPLLVIIHPDFSQACMKCLREHFLKICNQNNGQEFFKTQMKLEIQNINKQFSDFTTEFELKENPIKEDFCSFSSTMITSYINNLDKSFLNIKSQLQEQVSTKLLEFIGHLDKFDFLYQQMTDLVEKHGVINNRSLFQVFVDSLSYPQRIQNIKQQLYGLSSPNQIKRAFSQFITLVDQESKTNVENVLNENLAKIFIKDFNKFVKNQEGYVKKEKNIKSDKLQKQIRKVKYDQDQEDQEIADEGQNQPNLCQKCKKSIENDQKHEKIEQKDEKKQIDFIPPQEANFESDSSVEYFTYGDEPQPEKSKIDTQTQIHEKQDLGLDDLMKSQMVTTQRNLDEHKIFKQSEPKPEQIYSVHSIINRYFNQDETQNSITQSKTQKERILDMTFDQLQQKQNLAQFLYDQANNVVRFSSLKENQNDIVEAIESLGQGPHVILIDLNEQQRIPKSQTFILFDTNFKIIINYVVFENQNKNQSLQIINFQKVIIFAEYINSGKINLWQYQKEDQNFEQIAQFECLKNFQGKVVMQAYLERYLLLIIPNQLSYFLDLQNPILKKFGTLNILAPNSQSYLHEFRSVILNDKLILVMSSKRPNVNQKGKLTDNKKEPIDETQRIIIQNSQIYQIDLSIIGKQHKNIPQFQLVKLNLDTRPRSFQQFGVMPIVKENREIILIFGGDNPTRQTYLFDDQKREICKCGIYTGDQDKFLNSYIFQANNFQLAFGQTRVHIFDKSSKKFTGVTCYDFEYGGPSENQNSEELLKKFDLGENHENEKQQIENPEEDKGQQYQSGNIDDLLI